jgi:hypothetical protein
LTDNSQTTILPEIAEVKSSWDVKSIKNLVNEIDLTERPNQV